MNYLPGRKYGPYMLVSVRDVVEYESSGRLFVHEPTGCTIYHLANNDEENLFSFVFKTPPSDNKGTAHIIEHAVLSGSKRFPIKDPFIALTRGSMNTFLNAMTYPDKTMYPASSTVKKDFFNLLDVFGDAVFFPLLRRDTFHQEGRRYLFDEAKRIDIDGVVYNEMKGNYSSHDSIVGEWSYRSLFPDSPYRFDSGGEPEAIRDLSHEEFVDFHRTWYHPANCRIFLYGNIPSGEILDRLHERFLSAFPEGRGNLPIPSQPRWNEPRTLILTSPADEESEGKSTISINWLTVSIHDPLLLLSLEILAEILLGHSGSPLQKAIIESGIGEDLSPVSGLDTHTAELVFSVGVRGTEPSRQAAFEELVLGTLDGLVRNGIPGDIVTGALNRVEFRNREIKGGAPFGLRLLGKAIRGWLHDDPPELTLEFAPWMKKVTEHARRGGYFESLIDRLFVANPHRSTVVVTPDPDHGRREEERFDSWRSEKTRTLTPADLATIETDGAAFVEFQKSPDRSEDIANIPSLELCDLPRAVESIETTRTTIEGFDLNRLVHYTNGIVYLDLAFDVQDLLGPGGTAGGTADMLPLLCRALCGAGLPGVPYDEVARRLSIHTGGFSSSLESNTAIDVAPDGSMSGVQRSVVLFRLKSLESEFDSALDLAMGLLLEADLADATRMRDLLLEFRNDFRSQLLPSGNSFALVRAGRDLSPIYAVEERWKGISQYFHLGSLADDDGIGSVCDRLAAARSELITKARVAVSITAASDFMDSAASRIASRLGAFPAGVRVAPTVPIVAPVGRSARRHESLVTPTAVNYVVQLLPAAKYGDPAHSAEVIASQILQSGFLWERVRMQGGAYGVFAGANGGEGLFSLSSYRDPSIVETYDAFRDGLEFLASRELPESEIEKAIITVVGREVRPLSPSEKAMISFRRTLYGITDRMRQNKRNDLLAVTSEAVRAAAARLLAAVESSSTSVLAGSDAIDAAAKTRPEIGMNRTAVPV